jgi:hypothetical protein
MTRLPTQRCCTFCMAAIWAVTAGGLWLPGQAFSAWTVGTPIVTYWNAGSTLALTPVIAQQAVAGGYNLVWINDVRQLALARQHGLRAQLTSPLLSVSSLDDPAKFAQLNVLIDQFKASPAAYSYFLRDEPNADDFAGLARLVAHLRQRDADHLAYINLFPSYASNAQLGTKGGPATAFASYLDQYVGTVRPALLSYDHYQLFAGRDGPTYLQDLSMVAGKARAAGVPLMNIVQACKWDTSWRVPNANELRLLVYTTAAYGAQGISYFNYWTQQPNTGGLQPGADGTPTSVYTALTPLNKEFVAVVKQLQPRRWLGTYVAGYAAGALPPGTARLPDSAPFHLGNASNTASYRDGDRLKGLLLGFFGADSQLAHAKYVLVVNLDHGSTSTAAVTGPDNLSVFNATTGLWTARGAKQVTLPLPPGGGALVALTSAL